MRQADALLPDHRLIVVSHGVKRPFRSGLAMPTRRRVALQQPRGTPVLLLLSARSSVRTQQQVPIEPGSDGRYAPRQDQTMKRRPPLPGGLFDIFDIFKKSRRKVWRQEPRKRPASRGRNHFYWFADGSRSRSDTEVSQVSRRRSVRQQRDAIGRRFRKIPISRMWTSAVQSAQRRARHDPLSLFLVCLYFGRFFRKRPSAQADAATVSGKLPTYPRYAQPVRSLKGNSR
jgi:hypothetical protein